MRNKPRQWIYKIPIIICLFIVAGFSVWGKTLATTYQSSLTASMDSVQANGANATILTFNVSDNSTNPPTGISGLSVNFTASGGDLNVLSAWNGWQPEDGPTITAVTDGSGNAIIQFRSATAGIKNVTATVNGNDSLTKTKTITFTPIAGLTPPLHISNPTPNNSSKTSPTTTPNTNVPGSGSTPNESLAAPVLTSVQQMGKTITSKEPTLQAATPVVIAGTTIPNGIVTLYIYSTPTVAKITADSKGGWTYTISGLTSGKHHVEAEVTDPASGKSSARSTILAFSVGPSGINSKAKSFIGGYWSHWYAWVAAAIAVVLAIAIGYSKQIRKMLARKHK